MTIKPICQQCDQSVTISIKLITYPHNKHTEHKVQLQELSEHLGVNLANLSNSKTGNVKAIRFSTLKTICETLNVLLGDILGLLGIVFGLLTLLGLLWFYKYPFSHHGWLVRGDRCRHLYSPQKR